MIRLLVKEDKEQFINLMKMFIEERMSEFKFEFEYNNAAAQFDSFIGNDNIKGVVIDNDGEIDGAIVVAIGPMLCCKNNVAQELVWYVKPKSRGFAGIKLISKIREISSQCGCSGIIMIGMAGDRSNEFYIKNNFKPLQNMFYSEL